MAYRNSIHLAVAYALLFLSWGAAMPAAVEAGTGQMGAAAPERDGTPRLGVLVSAHRATFGSAGSTPASLPPAPVPLGAGHGAAALGQPLAESPGAYGSNPLFIRHCALLN